MKQASEGSRGRGCKNGEKWGEDGASGRDGEVRSQGGRRVCSFCGFCGFCLAVPTTSNLPQT